MRDGIVYVTEDRKIEGFFETMSIAENLYSGLLAAGLERGCRTSACARCATLSPSTGSSALNVTAINDNARVIELSGGNQQKVVIAKALVQKPKLIIFDEPTRGVDVGAIAEIHQLINRLADDGIAVIVISSYLPEILNLSDRILVCRQGRIVEEFVAARRDRGKDHVRGGALMADIVKALLAAPVNAVLLVAGLAFLGVAVFRRITDRLDAGPKGRLFAGLLGAVLVALSLYLSATAVPTRDITFGDAALQPDAPMTHPTPAIQSSCPVGRW